MIKDVITENAYLYSLWSGQLKVHQGRIRKDSRGGALFGNEVTRFNCSEFEKVVYNSVVWLEQRDDELAKQILIKYEEIQIAKLQEKISNHLHKIKILKG